MSLIARSIYGVINSRLLVASGTMLMSKKRPLALLEYSSDVDSESDASQGSAAPTRNIAVAEQVSEVEADIAPEVLDQLPEEVRLLTRELIEAERSLSSETVSQVIDVGSVTKTDIEAALSGRQVEEEDDDDDWLLRR